MNYEEKYKEALERAKVYHTGGSINGAHITGVIFPELKESEDEKIRKEIIDFITSSNKYGTNERCEAWLAWLEKDEQKQTWEPDAAQLIVIKDLIEDKNTSKVNKVILRGMFDEFKQYFGL